MKDATFLEILKKQSNLGKVLSLKKIKKDYYNLFLPLLNDYNKLQVVKIIITSLEYDTLFDKYLKSGMISKACCNSYKLNY